MNFTSGVHGTTLISQRNGKITPIKDLVGKKIEVFNGKVWETVIPQKGSVQTEFYRLTMGDGSVLIASGDFKANVTDWDSKMLPRLTDETVLPVNYLPPGAILENYSFTVEEKTKSPFVLVIHDTLTSCVWGKDSDIRELQTSWRRHNIRSVAFHNSRFEDRQPRENQDGERVNVNCLEAILDDNTESRTYLNTVLKKGLVKCTEPCYNFTTITGIAVFGTVLGHTL